MPFYWRIVSADHGMSLAHGTALSQDGLARQIEAFIATVSPPKILTEGEGVILVVQQWPSPRVPGDKKA